MEQKVIPFELNGYEGEVAVSYDTNEDPKQSGYDYLVQLGIEKEFDYSQCLGFPTMLATLNYSGPGYRSFLGWIQVVTTEILGRDHTTELIHDRYPAYADLDFPFCSFGSQPSFFDAPSTWNPDRRKNYNWTANTFLTTTPILSRESEEIRLVCSFRWGYHFDEDSTRPKIDELEVTGEDTWNSNLAYLRRQAQSWHFREASH
ncbi:MAG: hypothetical protein M1587_09075 [Thaumarchaeota archaeon]|nr:hypothetical protein [Nitrososphaerota archaeon]MCL5067992.1 hypothetical protein [Nitrososphaerota archaeon]MDG6908245.1 hypothetical protein [Nitrososphaerota archaeon]